jgi:hypothetical protein
MMSRRIAITVLERAQTDDRFRTRCIADPFRALGRYALRAQERDALVSGDPRLLETIGLRAAFYQCHSFPAGRDPGTFTTTPGAHRRLHPRHRRGVSPRLRR